ncbi:hypothetical protein IAR55_002043 [Kwoniella newhampshirensis]|uniref:Transmembrane protein n=1 Tax=Kwoniella newhampshirensis TaxID=1651941 RepID=A0AAW0YSS3_9TREE
MLSFAAIVQHSTANEVATETKEKPDKRGGTAPDGEVLPDWMTYVSTVVTVNDVPVTTGSIADLPLTYYGASIPLGEGWTYGGASSPKTSASMQASRTSTTIRTMSVHPQHTSSGTSSTDYATSTVDSLPTKAPSPDLSVPSPSASDSEVTSTSSSRSMSTDPTMPVSSTLLSTTPSSTPTPVIPHSITESPSSSTNHSTNVVLGLLLGVLIPGTIIGVFLCVLVVIYRRNELRSPSSFLRFLTAPSLWFATSARPTTPGVPPRSTVPPHPSSPGVRSPDEKSALLPRFVAQHHRNSSSLSIARDTAIDDELRDLVQQNQSLLQRLNLGLGWLTTSSNSTGSSASVGRRASGNTLEKGQGGGRRIFSGAAAAMLSLGTGKIGATSLTTPSTGQGEGYEKVLDDDMLFYKPPPLTRSSKATALSLPSDTDSELWEGSQSKKEETSPHSTGGPAMSALRGTPLTSFSIGIPETPATDSGVVAGGEVDLGEFGRRRSRFMESGERMHIPVPPGLGLYGDGTFGQQADKNRLSEMTTETEFHSAHSHLSGEAPLPSPGSPIYRDSSEYRHVSVSAFGSHPPAPARPPLSPKKRTTSSLSHLSSDTHGHVSAKLISPLPSSSLALGRVSTDVDNTVQPLRNLFELTPPRSAGPGSRSRESDGVRRSYAGQPMIGEDHLRQGQRGGIGEFGESIRPPCAAPTCIAPSRQSVSHESEIA